MKRCCTASISYVVYGIHEALSQCALCCISFGRIQRLFAAPQKAATLCLCRSKARYLSALLSWLLPVGNRLLFLL